MVQPDWLHPPASSRLRISVDALDMPASALYCCQPDHASQAVQWAYAES